MKYFFHLSPVCDTMWPCVISRRNHGVDFRQWEGVCDLRADHVNSDHNTHSVCDPPWEMKRISLSSGRHSFPLKSVYLNKIQVRNEKPGWCVSVECFWWSVVTWEVCLDYSLFRRKDENPQLCRDITLLSLLKNITTLIKKNMLNAVCLDMHQTFRDFSQTQGQCKYLFCFQLLVQTAGTLSSAKTLLKQILPNKPCEQYSAPPLAL